MKHRVSPHLDTEQSSYAHFPTARTPWRILSDAKKISVVAERCSCEFEEKCGGQKIMLTHGGRRHIGRQRQVQDGERQVDLARNSAGAKTLAGAKNRDSLNVPTREREGGKDHERKLQQLPEGIWCLIPAV